MNTNKPLIIEVIEIAHGKELAYYSSIIKEIITHFKLKEIVNHNVTYGYIFDVEWKRKALTTSLETINKKEILLSLPGFIEPDTRSSEFSKNLPLVVEVFNRYFLEEKKNSKLIVYKSEKKIEIHQLEKNDKIENEKLLKPYNDYFFSPKFDYLRIFNTIEIYEDNDVFRRLPEKVIERGKNLAKRYNPLYLQDLLWQFENLIIICCPLVSGENYEEVLNDFIWGTHGELKISDFKKTILDSNKCSISFKVNDKIFETQNPLPLEFSLGLIYQLNAFLSEEFSRSFYIWEWERSPWQQKNFIYLSNSTYYYYFKEMNQKEINPLEDYIVEYYDKYR